jgi:hypothetical protein
VLGLRLRFGLGLGLGLRLGFGLVLGLRLGQGGLRERERERGRERRLRSPCELTCHQRELSILTCHIVDDRGLELILICWRHSYRPKALSHII